MQKIWVFKVIVLYLLQKIKSRQQQATRWQHGKSNDYQCQSTGSQVKFQAVCPIIFAVLSLGTEYYEVKRSNHLTLCRTIENYSHIVFVFPLYVDSIPVPLLNFLKTLEENAPLKKPTISVIVNCGFIEPYQNDVAVEMLRSFTTKNGYPLVRI